MTKENLDEFISVGESETCEFNAEALEIIGEFASAAVGLLPIGRRTVY